MLSQIAFTQMVNVQSETIERYIRDGKIIPDMEVPVSEHRSFKFFQKSTVEKYAKHLGTLQFYKALVRQLTDEDYAAIRETCHAAIARYFGTAKA